MNNVHFDTHFNHGGSNLNTIVTSRQEIISASKKIAVNGGLQSLSIRSVAKECGVSIGSVYNYFDSKADLITAVIEDVWGNVFKSIHLANEFDSFVGFVKDFFYNAKSGTEEFPNFFNTHSMGFAADEKAKGRQAMNTYFVHLHSHFVAVIMSDKDIRADAFNESFTVESFVEFVVSNLLSLLVKHINSCDTLIEIIRRTIY